MPAVPEWDVLLRGGVLRALSQRGCRSGWTVSNFRGRARLHITARAGDGHRKQLLLPYPWESDQLESIRDGVVTVYEAFQNGVPLELSIAELGTAKAEAEARRQAEAMASQPSNPQQSVPSPAIVSRPISIDWAGLIRRYQQHKLRSGEIKETTWERLYKPRMALVLKTAKGPPAVRDAKHLLEAQADLWRQRPGCRTRRLQIQYTAALLRWGVSEGLLSAHWAPLPDLTSTIGRSRESKTITTPIGVEDILAMVQAIPDPRWRLAFQLINAFGLRPEELQHLQLRQGRLWCTYEKVASRGKTKPRPLRLLPCDSWAAAWNLVETFDPALLPPMRAGFGSDSFSRYLLRREHWQNLRRQYDAQGEKLVLYSCRHGYAHRAHVICDLPPKVVAAAMGHSVQTHLAAYSRWCGDDVVDDAFAKAEQRLGQGSVA
jgi:integrase